MFAKIAKSDH